MRKEAGLDHVEDPMERERRWKDFFHRIEESLIPCACGGAYKQDNPRRCLHCSSILEGIGLHQDIWPANEKDPTDDLFPPKDIWKE